MDKPSEWALEKAREILEPTCILYATGVIDNIAAALTAAHEAGRKVGLEQAAGVCLSRGSHLPDMDQRLEHERTARAIRAAGEVTR